MKIISLICAALLLLAIANLPIAYYTFLRYAITAGAIAAILLKSKPSVSFWDIIFIAIALLFNPFLPVYLYNKSIWTPIDILAAASFLVFAFREEKIN